MLTACLTAVALVLLGPSYVRSIRLAHKLSDVDMARSVRAHTMWSATMLAMIILAVGALEAEMPHLAEGAALTCAVAGAATLVSFAKHSRLERERALSRSDGQSWRAPDAELGSWEHQVRSPDTTPSTDTRIASRL